MNFRQSAKPAAILAGSVSLFALVSNQPAIAQQNAQADQPAATNSTGLEEIVVTARRKEEKAQSVPIAISNISTGKLEEQHIMNITDMTKELTGFSACCTSGYNLDASASHVGGVFGAGYQWIRGVSGVIAYWNNVPTVGGAGLFFDVDSVQLYKGPQGTLFGVATNGGAVQYTSKTATNRFEGYVEAEVGDYGHSRLDGILNVPVIDDVLNVRVGGRTNRSDGFEYDIAHKTWLGNINQQIGRLAIALRPTEDIQNDFTGTYFTYADNTLVNQYKFLGPVVTASSGVTNLAGLVTYGGPLDYKTILGNSNYAQAPFEQGRTTNLVNTTRWDISDNLSIKNIMGYVEIAPGTGYAGAAGPVGGPAPGKPQAVYAQGPGLEGTEELQLQGKVFNDKLSYTAGTWWSWAEGLSSPYTVRFTCPNQVNVAKGILTSCSGGSISNAIERINAVYAQGNYDLSDFVEGLSFTGGVRYTWDRFYGFVGSYTYPTASVAVNAASCGGNPGGVCYWSAKEASQAASYTMSLDWQIDSRTLLYVTNSKGFSRGGLNLTATLPAGPGRFFEPESLNQVEVGIKADWDLPLDMKARTNVALFYDLYDNIQVTTNTPIVDAFGQQTSAVVTQNAANGHISGVDFDLTLIPMEGLTLSGGGVFLDRHYDTYPYCTTFVAGKCTVTVSFVEQTYDVSSKWTWHMSAAYDLPFIDPSLGKATFTWNLSHIGPYIGTVGFPYSNPHDYVQSINLSDMSVAWRDFLGRPSLTARAYMTNVFSANMGQGSVPTYSANNSATFTPARPREWGVSLRYAFGP